MTTLPTHPSGGKTPDARSGARQSDLPFVDAIDLRVDDLADPRLGMVMDVGDLLALGFSLLPVRRDSKKPAREWKVWQQRHPTHEELAGWLTDGEVYNVGIITGAISNLVVIDLDNDRAIDWAGAHLPDTPMRVKTGGGGEHRYYQHPGGQVRNRVRIDTGDPTLKIDIRADGGYVIAPGSVHPDTGRRYEVIGSWPASVEALPEFDPAWLYDARSGKDHTPVALGVERTAVLSRARAYLEKVPPAVEGDGGDQQTFITACHIVRGFGLTETEAAAVLGDWNARCQPPWSEAELIQKIHNALHYGSEPLGNKLTGAGPPSGQRPTHPTATGARLEDFHAYLPMHAFLFVPTRELWPAASVNARFGRIPLNAADGTPVLTERGTPKTLAAATWLDQHRAVEQMTWAPGHPLLIHDRLVSDGGWIDRPGCTTVNLYRPPRVTPGDPHRASRWVDHVRRIYPHDVDHLMAWLAHRVQHPNEKINHALVFGGLQGIGKDTLLEPVKHAIGPWNFIEVGPQHLLGRFNGFVKSVILRVSEARDLGEVNRFAFYDHLKTYTAAPPDVLRVDEKNLREYAVFNVCGVIITTNHRTDGLFLPADDRRHYVAWSESAKEDFPPDYWTSLYRWYQAGGIQHVTAYLRDLDLSQFDAKAPPPQTDAFRDIVDANRAPEDAEIADALDRLHHPTAVTLDDLAGPGLTEFGAWLKDRKNARQVPHRLEAAGYVAVPNPHAKDRLWSLHGRRQVVYARQELPLRDRIRAVEEVGR